MFVLLKRKKINTNKINKIYSAHLYTGLNGLLMNHCHKQLEKTLPFGNYKKILEIGAGSQPHYNYLKDKRCEYTILEKNINKKLSKKFKYKTTKGNKIPFKNNSFDRIIISHTLEHIPEPEKFIKEMMSKLKKGAILSISLPTDPGLLWRIGRLFNKVFTLKKEFKFSSLEYDYMNAIEHINSIFNLINIIRHNYKDKVIEQFLPFRIKLLDTNLFYNVHIIK
jgi:phosphatidylethanolamine/phosphatidyl-N-methylethanolamine N-methyltransferase